jgi:hypothetical protein
MKILATTTEQRPRAASNDAPWPLCNAPIVGANPYNCFGPDFISNRVPSGDVLNDYSHFKENTEPLRGCSADFEFAGSSVAGHRRHNSWRQPRSFLPNGRTA